MPINRLYADGACRTAVVRRRIRLFAAERGLSPAEIAPAMTCGTDMSLRFAERHGLSLDWLLYGCLYGLLRQRLEAATTMAPQ